MLKDVQHLFKYLKAIWISCICEEVIQLIDLFFRKGPLFLFLLDCWNLKYS